ncbi:hypothetical protein BC830DRAFT_1084123 [Chytriomyces sp. MP71]|nr:hypothetical protein BC830DRAFT_1084123 [Chytriomyces sp. MP71]
MTATVKASPPNLMAAILPASILDQSDKLMFPTSWHQTANFVWGIQIWILVVQCILQRRWVPSQWKESRESERNEIAFLNRPESASDLQSGESVEATRSGRLRTPWTIVQFWIMLLTHSVFYMIELDSTLITYKYVPMVDATGVLTIPDLKTLATPDSSTPILPSRIRVLRRLFPPANSILPTLSIAIASKPFAIRAYEVESSCMVFYYLQHGRRVGRTRHFRDMCLGMSGFGATAVESITETRYLVERETFRIVGSSANGGYLGGGRFSALDWMLQTLGLQRPRFKVHAGWGDRAVNVMRSWVRTRLVRNAWDEAREGGTTVDIIH